MRLFLTLLFVLALFTPAEAQQAKKVPRIGFFAGGSGDPKTPGPQVEAFRQGLRDLGYIEGKNIQVELHPSHLTLAEGIGIEYKRHEDSQFSVRL
jgi:putative tryptophan/tyrosine transport system substrate-binding protein